MERRTRGGIRLRDLRKHISARLAMSSKGTRRISRHSVGTAAGSRKKNPLQPAPGGKTPHRTTKTRSRVSGDTGLSGDAQEKENEGSSNPGMLSIEGSAVRKPVVGGLRKDNDKTQQDNDNEGWDDDTSLSLPPLVHGDIEGMLSLSVDQILWAELDNAHKEVVVRAKWWGEPGHGVLFHPINAQSVSQDEQETLATEHNRVRYLIRSSYEQMERYLQDMKQLVLDVVESNDSRIVGHCVVDIHALSPTHAIDNFLAITRPLGNSELLVGELHVSMSMNMMKGGPKNTTTSTTTTAQAGSVQHDQESGKDALQGLQGKPATTDVGSSFARNEKLSQLDENLPLFPSPSSSNTSASYQSGQYGTPSPRGSKDRTQGKDNGRSKSTSTKNNNGVAVHSPLEEARKKEQAGASEVLDSDGLPKRNAAVARQAEEPQVSQGEPSTRRSTQSLSQEYEERQSRQRAEVQDSIDRLLARAQNLNKEMSTFSNTAAQFDDSDEHVQLGNDGYPTRASLGAISLVEHDGVLLTGSDDQLLNELFFRSERTKLSPPGSGTKHSAKKGKKGKLARTHQHKDTEAEDDEGMLDESLPVRVQGAVPVPMPSDQSQPPAPSVLASPYPKDEGGVRHAGKSRDKDRESRKGKRDKKGKRGKKEKRRTKGAPREDDKDDDELTAVHLYLQVTEAVDVPEPFKGLRSMYVACNMLSKDRKVTSAVVANDNMPRFNFFSQAKLRGKLDRLRDQQLVVQLWDTAGGPRDELVGVVVLQLTNMVDMFSGHARLSSLERTYPIIGMHQDAAIFNPSSQRPAGYLRLLLAMGSASQIARLQEHQRASVVLQRGYRMHLKNKRLGSSKRKQRRQPPELRVQQATKEAEDRESVVRVPDEDSAEEAQDEAVDGDVPVMEVQVLHCDRLVDTDSTWDWGSSSSSSSSGTPRSGTFGTCASFSVPGTQMSHVSGLLPVNGAGNSLVDSAAKPSQHQVELHARGQLEWTHAMQFDVWRAGIEFDMQSGSGKPVLLATLGQAYLSADDFRSFWSLQRANMDSDSTFIGKMFVLPVHATDEQGRRIKWGTITVLLKILRPQLLDVVLQRGADSEMDQGAEAEQASEDAYRRTSLSVNISRAAGLQSAAVALTPSYPFLRLASRFGVNAYATVSLLGDDALEAEYSTEVVARSFCPVFDFQKDVNVLLTPTVLRHLETGYATVKLWHRIPRGGSDGSSTPASTASSTQFSAVAVASPRPDVVLGVLRIPLREVLLRESGVHGWYEMRSPLGESVASIELSVCFSSSDSRAHALELVEQAHGPQKPMSQSPSLALEAHDDRMTFTVFVQDMTLALTSLLPLDEMAEQLHGRWVYVAYRVPGCQLVRSVPVRIQQRSSVVHLRHRCSFVVDVTSSLEWSLREEPMEIGVWTSSSFEPGSGASDSLLGCAYVHLSELLVDKTHTEGDHERDEAPVSSWVNTTCAVFHPDAPQHLQARLSVQVAKQHGAVHPNKAPSVASVRSRQTSVHSEASSRSRSTAPGPQHGEGEESSDESQHTSHTASTIAASGLMDFSSTSGVGAVEREEKLVQTSFTSSEDSQSTVREDDRADMVFHGALDSETQNAVHVDMVEARHLPLQVSSHSREIREKPNTFVSVRWNSNAPLQSAIVHDSVNPHWDMSSVFPVQMDAFFWSYVKQGALVFKVFHVAAEALMDSVVAEETDAGAGDFVGSARVPLFPLLNGLDIDGWYQLRNFKDEEVGLVRVRVHMNTRLDSHRVRQLQPSSDEYKHDVEGYSDAKLTTPGLSSSTGRKRRVRHETEGEQEHHQHHHHHRHHHHHHPIGFGDTLKFSTHPESESESKIGLVNMLMMNLDALERQVGLSEGNEAAAAGAAEPSKGVDRSIDVVPSDQAVENMMNAAMQNLADQIRQAVQTVEEEQEEQEDVPEQAKPGVAQEVEAVAQAEDISTGADDKVEAVEDHEEEEEEGEEEVVVVAEEEEEQVDGPNEMEPQSGQVVDDAQAQSEREAETQMDEEESDVEETVTDVEARIASEAQAEARRTIEEVEGKEEAQRRGMDSLYSGNKKRVQAAVSESDEDDDDDLVDSGWRKSPQSALDYARGPRHDRGIYPVSDDEDEDESGGAYGGRAATERAMSSLERAKRFQMNSKLTKSEAYMRALKNTTSTYSKEAERIERILKGSG